MRSSRFYRYLWYCIRLLASWAYRPVPLPQNPTYIASEDVTIIVPTIDAGEEFKEAAHSWLVGKPKEIIIVTEEKMQGPLQDLANAVDPERIRVLTVPFANKRLQMSHGIKNTTTDIIVFADDDAIWPPTLLPYTLACFEDQKVGGVGTSQRVQPCGEKFTVWEVLAAFRLSIRNIEISSSTHIDGGLPCLSGRTAAYRTVILKDPEFLHGFTHDYWLGKYHLNSGDDKFLTRWMISHGWSTYVQVCKEAELLSTMKPNWRFLKQVLRWTRNTWRSDLRSLFMERYIWTSHPYVAYTMVDKLFNPFTLLVGPVLVAIVIYKSTIPVEKGGFHLPWWYVYSSLLLALTLMYLPQECARFVHGLADRHTNSEAPPASLVATAGHHSCACVHRLRLLLFCHEGVCTPHPPRGMPPSNVSLIDPVTDIPIRLVGVPVLVSATPRRRPPPWTTRPRPRRTKSLRPRLRQVCTTGTRARARTRSRAGTTPSRRWRWVRRRVAMRGEASP
jgi:cellulose synthase/poly-beta-1,6-N-acetylglucosamine synthase-like glycosyltransferase